MKFLFGDIVVIEQDLIGVVVKTWDKRESKHEKQGFYYEIYVRSYNSIKEYHEDEVERYKVRHKELNEEEMGYQSFS